MRQVRSCRVRNRGGATPRTHQVNTMNRRQFTLSLAASAAGLTLLPRSMSAADYPTKGGRIICPFAPGGSGDISSRLFAEHISATTVQTFVVENRAGASGAICAAAVKNASP